MTGVDSIVGVHKLPPMEYADHRGSLAKLMDAEFGKHTGYSPLWRQVFVSRTIARNTVRGLHYQFGEGAEGKLISPIRGRMLWVAVDLRSGSESFGDWTSSEISPTANISLLIEPGFAHGCYSLSDDAQVLILSDADNAPEFGGGIRWDDEVLAIEWPQSPRPPIISEVHAAYSGFASFIKNRGAL